MIENKPQGGLTLAEGLERAAIEVTPDLSYMGLCAVVYGRMGYPVFPCDSRQDKPGISASRKRSKRPLVDGADIDENGQKIPRTGGLWRATTDEAQIRAWWKKWPDALIGVPTGSAIGAFVIDLDPRGGETAGDVYKRLVDAVGELPECPVSMTQSGGRHLWFKVPPGQAMPKNSAGRVKGVDCRGDGGYVIVPPSRMADGKEYLWLVPPTGLQALPDAHDHARLKSLLFDPQPPQKGAMAPGTTRAALPARPAASSASDDRAEVDIRKYGQSALDRVARDIRNAQDGQRSDVVNAASHGIAPFVGAGLLTERETFAALEDAFDSWGMPHERDWFFETARRGFESNKTNTARVQAKCQQIRDDHALRAARAGPQTAPGYDHSPEYGAGWDNSSSPPQPEIDDGERAPPAPPGGEQESRGSGFFHNDDAVPPAGEGGGEGAGCPVRALGHSAGVYYYLSSAGEVRRLADKDHKKLQLLSLFDGDEDWLIEHCPAFDKDGSIRPNQWSADGAARRLIGLCAAEGIFDPNTATRGPGVWKTGRGNLVVHVGNAVATLDPAACLALADGGEYGWLRAGQIIEGGYYTATAKCERPAKKAATRAEGAKLLEALRLWNYGNKLSADVICGFAGAALLGGAPNWRVHLLIAAQGGAGKTALMMLLDAAFGGMGAYANDASEAGLRQALTGETRVLLIDEAEGDEGAQGKVEGVIRLLRLMSSGAGASVMRGSAGGKGQSFQVTGCAVMAAILPPPLKPQDRSRICWIDLRRPPSGIDTARAGEAVAAATREMAKLAPALRTRAIAGWPRFLDTFALYRAGLVAKGLSARNADTLGTILAGRDLLLQDAVPDPDSVEADIERFSPLMTSAEEAEDEGEGQQCLTHLYSSIFDKWRDGERLTVAEIIMEAKREAKLGNDQRLQGLQQRMARAGLKIGSDGSLFVARQHQGLSAIFDGSKWGGGRWVSALMYLDGARAHEKKMRFGGIPVRAIMLPEMHCPSQTDDVSEDRDGYEA